MHPKTRTVIMPGWDGRLRDAGLEHISGVYEFSGGNVITRSRSSEVREVVLGWGADTRTIFIKKYWIERWPQLWKGMFRGVRFGVSKARREFENLEQFRAWNLDAPAPLAYGEERVAGWLTRSYLITEAVPAAIPLQVFLREQPTVGEGSSATEWRQQLLSNLAGCTRRLHEHRFVHGDYYWRNILLSGHDLSHFYLIDAHKGRKWFPGRGQRSRAWDLASLDAPAPAFFRRSERLRFFLTYLGQQRLDAPAKSLLRRVLLLAEPMRKLQLLRARGGGRRDVEHPMPVAF
jgi:hypothetical protein